MAIRLQSPARLRGALLPLLLLLKGPAVVQADDYTYTTNNGTITITGYAGSGGAVTIPDKIGGLPVTGIGLEAFYNRTSVVSVNPQQRHQYRTGAFSSCTS